MNKNVRLSHKNGLEIIDNEKYQIVVNNKSKVFSARKKFKEDDIYNERDEFYSFMDNKIDTLLMIYQKINTLEETEQRVKYEMIYKPNSEVEKTIVVINKILNVYESMTIFYKSPVKVKELDGKPHTVTLKIDYDGFKKNSVYDKELFNEKKYIMISTKNEILPVKKYSDYKLIISNEE
ncbi:MAG: hypothetical protein Q8L81_10355 [Bacteroidota bacterium]|nr:hypothetical protein [Bacteroidota bacterium]